VKETQQPASGLKRGAPDLARTPLARPPSRASTGSALTAKRSHPLRAGGHEITNTTTRVYAHATGESRQAALDELAMLIAGTGPGREQRAT
jgi:hypothetical protein